MNNGNRPWSHHKNILYCYLSKQNWCQIKKFRENGKHFQGLNVTIIYYKENIKIKIKY